MKTTTKNLPIFMIFFSLLLALTVFLDVLKTDDGDIIMDGLKAIFGGEVASIGSFASVDVSFSIMNFIAFFLPIILAILLFVLGGKRKKGEPINILLGLLLSASFVFSIVIINNLGMHTTGTVSVGSIGTNYNYEDSKLAIGSILALVFSAGGILSSLFYSFDQLR